MRHLAPALIALAMLTVPASAEWQGPDGVQEPSTAYDLEGPMWEGPPGGAHDARFYLDGFTAQWAGIGHVGPHPAPGPRILPPALYRNVALLGLWADCDGDGFIGSALTGTLTYPAALAEPTRCPAGGAYNDGARVDEWRAIHWGGDPAALGGVEVHPDRRDIVDPGARIWGDWMAPDGQATWSGSPLPPYPKGSLETWERNARLADLLMGGRLSDAVDGTGVLTYDNVLDLGRTLDDAGIPSPLVIVKNVWNSSHEGIGGERDCGGAGEPACEGAYAQPFVKAWDCRHPPILHGEIPLTGIGLVVPAPATPHPNADDGSLDGTLYQNTRGCEPEGEHLPYRNLERNVMGATVMIGKDEPDFVLHPVPDDRADVRGTPVRDVPFPKPDNCGRTTGCNLDGGYWTEARVRVRMDVDDGTLHARNVTYYANLTLEGLAAAGMDETALPEGNDPRWYGDDVCEDFGITSPSWWNGWSCNPTDWDPGEPKVGDPYDLRDVDCYGVSHPGFALVGEPCPG